jgi:transcription antitermination factor NusG
VQFDGKGHTNLSPETQLESAAFAGSQAQFPWFALQVRSQHEKGIAEFLGGKGYESFLPLHKCRKRWSDRVKEVELPLFPGYLFCRFNPLDRLPILKTPGVIQIVGYNRQPVAIEEFEIEAIQTLVASGMPNHPWPFLQAGERVRIESGSLRGVEGILTEFRGSHRLIVSITLLQRSVAVEIDSALVTPLRSLESKRSASGIARARQVQLAVY